MVRIGITGGVGTSKSVIRNIFASFPKVATIDTDSLAKRAIYTEEHKPLVASIFSSHALLASGAYNFRYIRNEFFCNQEKYKAAKQAFDVIAYKAIEEELAKVSGSKCVVVEAATLYEEQMQTIFKLDHVIVAYCGKEEQIARVMKRNGLTREEVESIFTKQMTDHERMSQPGAILVNTHTSLECLKRKVEEIYVGFL